MTDDATDDDATAPVTEDAAAEPTRTALRVVRGAPDDEQLAALLAVVSASGGEPDPEPAAQRGRWADPAALTRAAVRPGPGGWRAAAR